MGLDSLIPVVGAAGGFGQLAANKANEKQVDKQLQFQQYNADTAVQRRVADLTKAGSIRPWHTRAKPLHQEERPPTSAMLDQQQQQASQAPSLQNKRIKKSNSRKHDAKKNAASTMRRKPKSNRTTTSTRVTHTTSTFCATTQ